MKSPDKRSRTVDQARRAGRRGDTELVHATKGELVIPRSLQTPEVMGLLHVAASAQAVNLDRYRVGSPEGPRNPKSLLEEFWDGGDGDNGDGGGMGNDGAYGSDADNGDMDGAPGHGDNGTGVGVGMGGGMGGGIGSANAADGVFGLTTADRDAAYGSIGVGVFGDAFDAPNVNSLGIIGTGIKAATMGPIGLAVDHGAALAQSIGYGLADAFGYDRTADYSMDHETSGSGGGIATPAAAALKPVVPRPTVTRAGVGRLTPGLPGLPSLWG